MNLTRTLKTTTVALLVALALLANAGTVWARSDHAGRGTAWTLGDASSTEVLADSTEVLADAPEIQADTPEVQADPLTDPIVNSDTGVSWED